MKPTLLAAFFFFSATAPVTASDPDRQLRHNLQHATPCEWEALFRSGVATEPLGATRGTVLAADGFLPKIKARVQGTVWKGKNFPGDGTLINRWLIREAVRATVCVGPSRLDGQPCVVMQYADNAPVFAGVRDEVREIAPGVWLGRNTDGRTGRLKGWFLLQAANVP